MPVSGFPPIAAPHARLLILGSLPGRMSLERGEYYAQPRNAFWTIMGALFGAGPELPYATRTARLADAGVALWDVCAAAQRAGSLDAAIDRASVVPNDFPAFFAAHPHIRLLAFNGGKAAELFRRCVTPMLADASNPVRQVTLPSTSPAHAAMPPAEKMTRWAHVLQN
ncbi:MAG: DNA-deoxyinosine glycosylase [Thiobacillus sp. 65-69]|jgi:hypoxanthine-DNA glycosylase|nr:DNA-deoxyinosine glycosylase [Thiobacillus sp.]ODU89672.1 MAG: DNA-deoxyinosine glycosylase [Thiobacillus sp. SCN 65-179]OJW37600.1 MAG: DNA-deoxyinosine glycosylase [Thiobacillus sp. 65-69]